MNMEDVTLIGGQTLRVHNRKMCEGRNCCIHNPSDTPMKHWVMNWRSDAGKMERMCMHDVGHPDPDDMEYRKDTTGIHGCCPYLCCAPSYEMFRMELGG
jgi:hypothetical protein